MTLEPLELAGSSRQLTARRMAFLKFFALAVAKAGEEWPHDPTSSDDAIVVLLALAAELAQHRKHPLSAFTRTADMQWSSVRDHGGPLQAVLGIRR